MALIATQVMRAPFAVNPTAGQLQITWTAGNTGGDTVTITGREIVLGWNSGASPYTVGVTSQVDGQNRTGDISGYSLVAGDIVYLSAGLTNSPGWKNQSTGLLTITPSNAAIKWAVLQLPVGYPG